MSSNVNIGLGHLHNGTEPLDAPLHAYLCAIIINAHPVGDLARDYRWVTADTCPRNYSGSLEVFDRRAANGV
jgi:hypothetical protein